MKHLILLLTFSLFCVGVNAQSKGKETITVKTNIYCDHCKKCESCGPRIYRQLMDVSGIRKVDINEDEATITVSYSTGKIDADGVRKAINDTGFDADDQLAPAESVAKLDMCCKK
jgi:periplasmic mercuric ion binding protein